MNLCIRILILLFLGNLLFSDNLELADNIKSWIFFNELPEEYVENNIEGLTSDKVKTRNLQRLGDQLVFKGETPKYFKLDIYFEINYQDGEEDKLFSDIFTPMTYPEEENADLGSIKIDMDQFNTEVTKKYYQLFYWHKDKEQKEVKDKGDHTKFFLQEENKMTLVKNDRYYSVYLNDFLLARQNIPENVQVNNLAIKNYKTEVIINKLNLYRLTSCRKAAAGK